MFSNIAMEDFMQIKLVMCHVCYFVSEVSVSYMPCVLYCVCSQCK